MIVCAIGNHRRLCFFPCADVHRIDPGGDESVPGVADLHGGADPGVPRQEDRRDAAAHLRDRRQRVHEHEALRAGPVCDHQVPYRLASFIRTRVVHHAIVHSIQRTAKQENKRK